MSSISSPRERLLSRREAAELLGVKPQTLALWAMRRKYLAVVKCGRACRYRLAEIDRFIKSRTIGTN
jgi:predicted DNA-binding transcriptional regulator AlpA